MKNSKITLALRSNTHSETVTNPPTPSRGSALDNRSVRLQLRYRADSKKQQQQQERQQQQQPAAAATSSSRNQQQQQPAAAAAAEAAGTAATAATAGPAGPVSPANLASLAIRGAELISADPGQRTGERAREKEH